MIARTINSVWCTAIAASASCGRVPGMSFKTSSRLTASLVCVEVVSLEPPHDLVPRLGHDARDLADISAMQPQQADQLLAPLQLTWHVVAAAVPIVDRIHLRHDAAVVLRIFVGATARESGEETKPDSRPRSMHPLIHGRRTTWITTSPRGMCPRRHAVIAETAMQRARTICPVGQAFRCQQRWRSKRPKRRGHQFARRSTPKKNARTSSFSGSTPEKNAQTPSSSRLDTPKICARSHFFRRSSLKEMGKHHSCCTSNSRNTRRPHFFRRSTPKKDDLTSSLLHLDPQKR